MGQDGYKGLVAYQKAMELAKKVYELSGAFPAEERFGLTAQVRRASVSVPSNIAEGHGKTSSGEYLQALGHARGSLYEVETQVILAVTLGFIDQNNASEVRDLITDLSRVLEGLHRSIKLKRSS